MLGPVNTTLSRSTRLAGGELRYLRKVIGLRRTGVAGVCMLGVLALLAITAPLLKRFPPEQANPNRILRSPNGVNWLGTDINGMDIFSRLLFSLRVDLGIAVAATVVSCLIGTIVGSWAGFYSGRRATGWLSEVVMRAVDSFQAFPLFILALGLVAVLGRTNLNILMVLTVLSVPIFLRLTRSAVLALREESFIDASRCSGRSERGVLIFHVLPNALRPSITIASAVAGSAILVTAGLGYLGAGVPAPAPELGSMVAVGASTLYSGQWWPAFFPGIVIGICVLAFAWIGEIFGDYLDPANR